VISVTLPLRISNPLNGSQGRSRAGQLYRAKQRAEVRNVVRMALWPKLGGRMPASGVTVTLTRIAPRALDDDGWEAGAKAARDGVADALGIRDNDPRVEWRYAQERGAVREYAVRLEIAAS